MNNRSNILVFVGLIMIGVLSICGATMRYPLRLTISLDKNNVAVGDVVHIEFVLKNVGDADLAVVGRGLYESDWIKVFDPQMQSTPSHKKIEFSVRWPNDNEVLILRKGESSNRTFIGTIRKDQVLVGDKLIEKTGLFLDFQNSSIQLEGPGTYAIQGSFQSDDLWGNQAKDRFKNIWSGQLLSSAVKFRLSV